MKNRTLLRFWLSKDIYRDHIRVEWRGPRGVQTSVATLDARRFGYRRLVWGYDTPPEHVAELALECIVADGEYVPAGCVLMGAETNAEMEAAVEGEWQAVAA